MLVKRLKTDSFLINGFNIIQVKPQGLIFKREMPSVKSGFMLIQKSKQRITPTKLGKHKKYMSTWEFPNTSQTLPRNKMCRRVQIYNLKHGNFISRVTLPNLEAGIFQTLLLLICIKQNKKC